MTRGVLHLVISCTVLYFSSVFLSPIQAQDIIGTSTWENTDPYSGVLSKLFIDTRNWNLTAYEDCMEGDCSWGSERMMPTDDGFVVTYFKDFTEYEIFVRPLNEDLIQVVATTKYKDCVAGDVDVLDYDFVRISGRGSSGGYSNK